jgi:murein L,D-transpeptidase YafK
MRTSVCSSLNLSILITILFFSPHILFASGWPVYVNADRIIVEKSKRTLTLYSNGNEIKQYKIALGESPEGHKTKKGDNRTPEGIYIIDARNEKSRFHKSLHISYPNENDMKNAERLGVTPGGNIMIHGLKEELIWTGKFHTVLDWTEGCIAVTNDEIEEIWDMAPDGTVVEIRP